MKEYYTDTVIRFYFELHSDYEEIYLDLILQKKDTCKSNMVHLSWMQCVIAFSFNIQTEISITSSISKRTAATILSAATLLHFVVLNDNI